MPNVAEAKIEEEATVEMLNMCSDLFREWWADLTFEKKQVWLWNASVEMIKIKQRRKP